MGKRIMVQKDFNFSFFKLPSDQVLTIPEYSNRNSTVKKKKR